MAGDGINAAAVDYVSPKIPEYLALGSNWLHTAYFL